MAPSPSPFQDVSTVSQYSPPVLLGCSIFLIIFPMIIVGLRFYTRKRFEHPIGADDWLILFAQVLSIAAGITVIIGAQYGELGAHQTLGDHGQLVHTPQLAVYEKCKFANLMISTFNLGVVKIAVLLFYRRIFTTRRFEIVNNVMMGFIALWTIAMTLTMAFECNPPSQVWEEFELYTADDCIRTDIFYQAVTFLDLALDVLVVVLPIPAIISLQMPWRRKIAIVDQFLLMTIVFASGIARVITYMQIEHETSIDFFYDVTWWTAGALFWNFAENAVAIVGACLPTLGPLCYQRKPSRSNDGGDTQHHREYTKNPYPTSSSNEGTSVAPSYSERDFDVHVGSHLSTPQASVHKGFVVRKPSQPRIAEDV